MPRDLGKLEYRIGYYFKDKSILKEAMTHASVRVNNLEEQHHERLEFFGDAILYMVMSEYYFKTKAKASPGELTLLRKPEITEERQYEIAVDIQLMEYVEMATALSNQGCFKRWGEFVEALIAAVYVDAETNRGEGKGLEMAKEVIYRLWDLELPDDGQKGMGGWRVTKQ